MCVTTYRTVIFCLETWTYHEFKGVAAIKKIGQTLDTVVSFSLKSDSFSKSPSIRNIAKGITTVVAPLKVVNFHSKKVAIGQ